VGEKMKVQCGSCTSCIDICPVKAFKGRIFKSEEDVLERFDVVKCHQYRRGVLKKKFGFDGCGLCLAICPYGKPKTRKSSK
jgi:epoxyqueuosine reductase